MNDNITTKQQQMDEEDNNNKKHTYGHTTKAGTTLEHNKKQH